MGEEKQTRPPGSSAPGLPGQRSYSLQLPHLESSTSSSLLRWAKGLEVVTLDVKDAYLNVPQVSPVLIYVDKALVEEGAVGEVPFILERLLPGQRIAAAEWFQFVKEMLVEGGMENFPKEPTLFRAKGEDDTGMILHADDGILASTRQARGALVGVLAKKVEVKTSDPLEIGQEIEFLKRRYIRCEDGVIMMSGTKHLEGLLNSLGHDIKERDAPADGSFVEEDNSEELNEAKKKLYQECVGRLLYLSLEPHPSGHPVQRLGAGGKDGTANGHGFQMASQSHWLLEAGPGDRFPHQARQARRQPGAQRQLCWSQ